MVGELREMEEVGVHLFLWEEVAGGVHDLEISDYGIEELVEEGREEDCGPHEAEGLQLHYLGLGGYSEMEGPLYLCGE